MELVVNQRGNLSRPVPKLRNWLISAVISLVAVSVLAYLNAGDIETTLDVLPWVIAFSLFLGAAQFLIDRFEGEIEFDRHRQCVTMKGRLIAPYKSIRHVRIAVTRAEHEEYFLVQLGVGAARRYTILRTDNETEASLAAADIAREIDRPVVVER